MPRLAVILPEPPVTAVTRPLELTVTAPLDPLDDEKGDAGNLNADPNQLGYYPPALALVVKAPSLVHARDFNLPLAPAGMAAPAGGEVRFDDKGRKINVAPEEQERDPKKIWEAALLLVRRHGATQFPVRCPPPSRATWPSRAAAPHRRTRSAGGHVD